MMTILRGRPRRRQGITRVIAMLALLGMILTGMVVASPERAHALGQYGAGAHGWAPNPSTWLGNFILPNGVRVYCIDIYNGSHASSDHSNVVTTIPASPGDGRRAVTGNELRWLNYLVTVYGQTANAYQAAAVSALVYNVTSQNNHGTDHYISAAPQQVKNLYWSMKAAVNANYLTGGGTGTGNLEFHVDPQNNYVGTLSVTGLSPSNALGTITLTNGVFTDTGLPTRSGVTNNSSYPVRGVPPVNQPIYKIYAQGAFTAPGAWNANIRFYRDGSAQGAISAGTRTPRNFILPGEDPMSRSAKFQPVVGTRVASKFVNVGDEFVDVLKFGLAADANGHIGEWQRNAAGRYAPITARGTLYGPFLEQPAESALPPVGAPVVATNIMVTTDPVSGPTVEYTVPSGYVSQEAGFYTWVWEILATDQPDANPNVRQFLPDNYHFRDKFGQVVETSITPMRFGIATQVTAAVAGVGELVSDEVTITPSNGVWLEENGSGIPVTVTGTAYYSATVPQLSDTPPVGATVVGVTKLTFTGQGTVVSDPVRMPFTEGWVTFQWCVVAADQPPAYQGMVTEGCDKYGQASETVRLRAPGVTTKAREVATVYDPLVDVATVNGNIADDVVLTFALFQQPVAGMFKRLPDGSLSAVQWTQAEIDALAGAAVCMVENRVAVTAGVPVTAGVNSDATYQSPEVFVDETGVFWWVESLVHEPTGTVIAAGICGLPNETTRVEKPKVTTKAQPVIRVGERARDTAIVTGPIPAAPSGIVAELTFQVFRDRGGTPVCDASTLVKSFTTPIVVTGAGEYQSAGVRLPEPGTYYWVETLTYVHPGGAREVVHRGECGLPNETTRVLPGELGVTGSDAAGVQLTVGVVALLIGAGVCLLVVLRRRRVSVARTVV